ncbi:HSF-type DNA-binding protein [Achlya hypogyna]|uniref:HSF-type DNA-binding protein n=1 Tax=Achlya hypogyna TaxID=1202772 RepID=A0A1V9Y5S7_ACHHY|nr:HSF-type DNA-binding protein [Achlya hypogyna]
MQQPPSPSSSSEHMVTPTKKRKVGVPKFLRYLYQILEKEDASIISWANGGTSIQILDTDRVAQYILPKYFKHSKYASFQRQLNYFGFRKWTKSQTNICTFSHPEFRQNRPDRLYLIKRKNSPESSRKKPSKVTESAGSPMLPPSLMPPAQPFQYQMRQMQHMAQMGGYDFMPASTSPSAFNRNLFPTELLELTPKKEMLLFKPSPTTTPINSHLMTDIENLQIQGDGPSFNLLDVNQMMFGAPPPALPEMKEPEGPFDFDMNCAWLDSFTPVDHTGYSGAFANQAEYA